MARLAQKMQANQVQPGVKLYKKGGAVTKHNDEAMDRQLVKKMVKGAALTGKKCGGLSKSK